MKATHASDGFWMVFSALVILFLATLVFGVILKLIHYL